MTHPVDPNEQRWLALSALSDGEADSAEVRQSIEHWRDDAACRERWHAYQFIGDVMRSDDLAGDAAHDQAFLLAIRQKLAAEPVVLAPARNRSRVAGDAGGVALSAMGAAGGRRLRWGAPAAVAAGVMVTGALVMLTVNSNQSLGGVQIADKDGPASPTAAASAVVAEGDILRDPEIDRYLKAHRQFSGGPSFALPGGLRQVAVRPDGP